MQKALIVATVYNFISSFEKSNIEILKELGYEVWCACNTDESNGQLEQLGVHIMHIPFARNPFRKENITSYKMLKTLIKQEQFDMVHCHTPVGGVLARLAVSSCGVSKIIYTAHGFHFFNGAPKINWMIYYPIEKWLARKTDVLITINHEDYHRAKEKFRARKIEYIPGVGVDTEKIQKIVQKIDREQKRSELGIPENVFLLASVGELSKRKNHSVTLETIAKLKDENVWCVICGTGVLEKELKQQIDELEIRNRVKLLGYRRDVVQIMACADAYIHPAHQEGLPVAVMEAMSVGLPVIASKIRGNEDLLTEYSAEYLCENNRPEEYVERINKIVQNEEERSCLEENNLTIIQQFDVRIVKEKMKDIYMDCSVSGGRV